MVHCYRCDSPLPVNSRYCQACGATVADPEASLNTDANRDSELEARLSAELAGEYVIERFIGRGGMASVYLARELELNRRVALKVLPPELAYGPGMIERFRREARTAATLDHPHIVPIFRTSLSGKLVWFAMKYIEGESLADLLRREKSLPAQRTSAILRQVAEALEFAHRHGVIHRDVKPANVMIDSKDWVIMTDFGIAKALDMQPLTGSGAMIGTPSYMSPEQCDGKQPITGASDQYSLGVMAYELLSGRLPFSGFSAVDIIKQHCLDQPLSLDTVRPGLPQGLARVVECALAKDPSHRFPTVTAFANSFTAVVHGQAPTLPVHVAARPRRVLGRRRAVLWTMIGLAFAAAALLLWWPGPRQTALERENQLLADEVRRHALPSSVRVVPNQLRIRVGERYGLHAMAYDILGDQLAAPHVVWSSNSPQVAQIDSNGTVVGVASGEAFIQASAGQHRGLATVEVLSTTSLQPTVRTRP